MAAGRPHTQEDRYEPHPHTNWNYPTLGKANSSQDGGQTAHLGHARPAHLNRPGGSGRGTLARVRRIERPQYGYYVDHVCDIYGSVALLAGMAGSGLLDWRLALALLIAFLVAAAESFLAVATLQRFEMAHWGVGPTELRLLLIAGNVAALVHPPGWFNLGAGIGAVGLLATTTGAALRHARELRGSAERHRDQPGHHHADAEQGDRYPERRAAAAAAAVHEGENQGDQSAEKSNHGQCYQ